MLLYQSVPHFHYSNIPDKLDSPFSNDIRATPLFGRLFLLDLPFS